MQIVSFLCCSHLFPVPLYHIPHYRISGTIFGGGGVIEHKMCGLSFSVTYIWNISHSNKNQKHRSWQLYSNEKNGLQQFQMESCQPIKRLKDKKKKKKKNKMKNNKNKKNWTSTIIYVHRSSRKVPVILVIFSCNLNFLRRFFEKYWNVKFHENSSIGSLVVPCGRKDAKTDMTKLMVAFRSFANSQKHCNGMVSSIIQRVYEHLRQFS